MKNYAKFDFFEIQAIFTNAEIINGNSDWQAIGVSTNTRTIEAKNIFVALAGEKFDGHNYIEEAITKNASAIVVEKKWYHAFNENILAIQKNINHNPPNILIIVVENTIVALGELAFFHRMRFNFPVLAIAGSNGKTSTKELIYSVLSQKYKTLKTYKNFNNRIGVPLMMLQFSEEYEMAIIEIGTNEPGEIAILSKMLSPNYGLITNIGKEHLELLKDLDEVEIEETFLFGQLLKTGGNCFINFDDARLKKYAKVITNNITYGAKNSEINAQADVTVQKNFTVQKDDTVEADFTVEIEFDDFLYPTLKYKISHLTQDKIYSVKINSIGLAIALNAIAAVAVGYGTGLTGEEISEGLENFEPAIDGYARMVVEEINGIKVLNDCYNANPSSMEMSLKTLSMLKNIDYKIAILGDMFELGDSAKEEHISIINLALNLADEVIVTGSNMTTAANELHSRTSNAKLKAFNIFSEISEYISDFNSNADSRKIAILVKASRGMAMEKLIEKMHSRHGCAFLSFNFKNSSSRAASS